MWWKGSIGALMRPVVHRRERGTKIQTCYWVRRKEDLEKDSRVKSILNMTCVDEEIALFIIHY